MSNKQTKPNVPQLRFPEFSGEWENTKLGTLANIVRGASPRPISDAKWFDKSSSIGWLRISDVTAQKGRIKFLEQRLSDLGAQKTRVLYTPHLLLSIAATVGKPVINYVETGVHDGFLIFQNPNFDIEYMYHWLEMFQNKWKKYGQPGSQINLNSDIIKKQNIYIPTAKEQQKIGRFFSKIDRQIELEEKKLALLEEQKKGYMQKIFSQELRFKDENGNDYPEWEEKMLGDIMTVTSVKRVHQSDWKESGIRFLRARDIVAEYKEESVENPIFISKELYEKHSGYNGKVSIGDLLVTGVGTIGIPKLIVNNEPLYFKDGNIIWFKNNVLNGNYFYYIFLSNKVQKFISNVAGIGTVGTYTIKNARKTKVFVPVLQEQEKIGGFLNRLNHIIKKQKEKTMILKYRKISFLNLLFF